MTTDTETAPRHSWHSTYYGMTADELTAVNAPPPPPRLTPQAHAEMQRRDFIEKIHPAIFTAAQQMSERAQQLGFYDQWRHTTPEETHRREFLERIWRAAHIAATGGVSDPAANVTEVISESEPGKAYTVSLNAPIFCTCPHRPARVIDTKGNIKADKFCKHSLAVIIARRAQGITAEPPAQVVSDDRTPQQVYEGMNPAALQRRLMQEHRAANPRHNPHMGQDLALLRRIKRQEREEWAGVIYTTEEK